MINFNPVKPSNGGLTKRLIFYFFISLIIQAVVAYGAVVIFVSLPSELTGLADDQFVERKSQQGTVYLLREQIKSHPELSPKQVLESIQPEFGFRLQIFDDEHTFSEETIEQLNTHNLAYDSDTEMVYATLDAGQYLALGPLVGEDIFSSDMFSFSIFLLIFAGISSVMFCLILYFAFSYLWRDVRNMTETVGELGKGNLKVRAKPAKSWLFKQLSGIINTMCNQIDKLISSNRIILHSMAHELRTPLARMNFEMEMLADTRDEEEKQKLISEVNNDIKELEVLITTSLNYFKMQQIQLIKDVTEVPLKTWTMEVVNNLHLLKPANFDLKYDIDDTMVLLDKQLVETVVKNLVLNAFKYATNQAVIRLHQKEDLLFIIIDDDGPGVSLAYREDIFLPFSRIDSSRTKSTGGYGLGLAYVKLLAEYCQGDAFVITSPLGGARFVVTMNFT